MGHKGARRCFETATGKACACGGVQGDIEEARLAVQRLLQFGLVLGSLMVAGLYAGHDYLPSLFSKDPAVVVQAGATLAVISFSMVCRLCTSVPALAKCLRGPVHGQLPRVR